MAKETRRKLTKKAAAYFERNRSGQDLVFDTRGSVRAYTARYRACQELIEKGYIEGTAHRDSGFAFFYRILHTPGADDVRR